MREATPPLKRFSESLQEMAVCSKDKIVVAVSGGPDSVCLLRLFLKTGFSDLHVAHLNHDFRRESDQEAIFVADLCQSWGIPCTVEKRNVLETCKQIHLSKQEGARLVRYRFLQEVANTQKASVIALGHTADDQVETLLTNLLRGSGMTGQTGMPMRRTEEGRHLIRPMLSLTRDEILAELSLAKISFVEDASNQDRRYLRNRIRHELIPLLETYNPRIRKALLQGAELSRQENDFMDKTLAEIISKIDVAVGACAVSFSLSLFSSLHLSVKRRLLRWGIFRLRGHCRGIGFEHIETVLTKILGIENGKRLGLPDRMTVRKTKTRLIIEWINADMDSNQH